MSCGMAQRKERFFQQRTPHLHRGNGMMVPKDVIELQTSGSTGTPKVMQATKSAMRASAQRTLDTLGVSSGSTALLCLPLQYVAGK